MRQSTPQPARQKGAIFLTLLYGLPVLLAMVGLAVDFGQYYLIQFQAQTAADAAAWGGALQRGRDLPADTSDPPSQPPYNYPLSRSAAEKDAEWNGFKNGVDNTTVTVNIPPEGDNPLPQGITAWTDDFVEVVVTKKVPTFLLGFVNPGLELWVKARAIAGVLAGGTRDSGLMTLSGDFTKHGAAEDWIWNFDVHVGGNINTTGNGSLTADSIACGGNDCPPKKGWSFTPGVTYDPKPPADPWAKRMNKTFTAAPGGVCKYVYTTANPFKVGNTQGSTPNPGILPYNRTDRKIALQPGIHCVDSYAAWQPDQYIDGAAGVALYVNNPDNTLSLPNGSRLVAMDKDNPQLTDADFEGMALYGTGDFELQAGGPTVRANGAFYFPNGEFSVLGSAAIVPAGTPRCLQVVANSINLRLNIFGGPEDNPNDTSCVPDDPDGDPTEQDIRIVK